MEESRPRASRLWDYINRYHLREEDIRDLDSFKSSRVNHKLTLWNPGTNGVRYLKALIFNICSTLTEREWEKLKKIRGRDLGNPYAVIYNGETVCLDYLQTVFEINFIEKGVNLQGTSVIEIGAGYGRTCHALLSNYDISRYTIIDLRNALGLSRSYLKAVLDDQAYSKINFVEVDLFHEVSKGKYDLCVNIDSFAEMEERTVRLYLAFVDNCCGSFYVKNPVGKYLDMPVDGQKTENEVVAMAMETGIMRDVVDIYDNEAVLSRSGDFIAGYRPSMDWSCLDHGWARPWSFYWQALYRRR